MSVVITKDLLSKFHGLPRNWPYVTLQACLSPNAYQFSKQASEQRQEVLCRARLGLHACDKPCEPNTQLMQSWTGARPCMEAGVVVRSMLCTCLVNRPRMWPEQLRLERQP